MFVIHVWILCVSGVDSYVLLCSHNVCMQMFVLHVLIFYVPEDSFSILLCSHIVCSKMFLLHVWILYVSEHGSSLLSCSHNVYIEEISSFCQKVEVNDKMLIINTFITLFATQMKMSCNM